MYNLQSILQTKTTTKKQTNKQKKIINKLHMKAINCESFKLEEKVTRSVTKMKTILSTSKINSLWVSYEEN